MVSPPSSGARVEALSSSSSSFNTEDEALETVIPGRVTRLRSNDRVVVRVGVRNRPGVRAGARVGVSVVVSVRGEAGVEVVEADGWEVVAGIPEWTAGDESLRTHEAPEWVSCFDCLSSVRDSFDVFVFLSFYSLSV